MIKKGDSVVCIKGIDPGNQFTVGNFYIVHEADYHDDWLMVVADDSGFPNGWELSCFEEVTTRYVLQSSSSSDNTSPNTRGCECGAWATGWQDDHMGFCPKFRKVIV